MQRANKQAKKRTVWEWIQTVERNDRPVHWCAQLFMLLAASPFFIGGGMSLATGLGQWADVVLFVSAMWLAARFAGFLVAFALALLPNRLPCRMIGTGTVLMVQLVAILQASGLGFPGSLVVAAAALTAGLTLGCGVWLVFGARRREVPAFFCFGLGLLLAGLFYGWLFADGPGEMPVVREQAALPAMAQEASEADNPAKPGRYRAREFTYGSGFDRYRPEFAEEAAIRTGTADASALLADWGWSRRWLWGAGPDRVPLNGRVWMPEAPDADGSGGPFPVVLIMHGNHSMGRPSDEGYRYLGELLASRGYLTVSVDGNFLNYSTWEGNLGDLGENITLRAWLFLQHLLEIESLSQAEGNLLSGKADMSRIALIGHSRGGQAALLAAEFENFFAGDRFDGIRIGRDFDIDAVVALAPTDMLVDNRHVSARHVNYLLLQGTHDADVSTFPGERQFDRLEFRPFAEPVRMKTSLYIKGANHGQFNEDWARRDIQYPAQWLLDEGELLSGEEQRQIASLYVSAFLDTALGDTDRYLPLLRDIRLASGWLPDTPFILRYSDSRFAPLANFDEDKRKESGWRGAALRAVGADVWEEEELENRQGGSRFNRVGILEWTGDEAALVIDLPETAAWPDGLTAEAVGLDLADLSGDAGELDITVEVETRDGLVLRAELDAFPPVPEPLVTDMLKPFPGGLLEEAVKDGALAPAEEIVLQTYYLPLDADVFEPVLEDDAIPMDEGLEPDEIGQIRIVVEKEEGGAVALDEIGLFLSHF